MTINASTCQAGVLQWKLAGICRALASYAAGSWFKKALSETGDPRA